MKKSVKNTTCLTNVENTLSYFIGDKITIFCKNRSYRGTLISITSDGVCLQYYNILNRKGYNIEMFESEEDESIYIKFDSIEAFSNK